MTEDIDITPATDFANLTSLAEALRELRARLRSATDEKGVSFPFDAAMLRTAQTWNLTTTYGDLDLAFTPSGTKGYKDLRREASRVRLGAGLKVTVAALRDVIRSKEAAGRDKDLAQLPILRRTLEEMRRRSGKGRRS